MFFGFHKDNYVYYEMVLYTIQLWEHYETRCTYQARKSSDMIRKIEYDLTNNCLWLLMQNLQLNDLSDLLDAEVLLSTSPEPNSSCIHYPLQNHI